MLIQGILMGSWDGGIKEDEKGSSRGGEQDEVVVKEGK